MLALHLARQRQAEAAVHIPLFSWLSEVSTDTHVTSDPVPAVVGTWISGKRLSVT